MKKDSKLNEYKWVVIPTHKNLNHVVRVCDILRIVGIDADGKTKSKVYLRDGDTCLLSTATELEVLELIKK